MTTPEPNNLDFLLQLDVIEDLIPKIGKEQWQTLYRKTDVAPHRFSIWCALLDEDYVEKAIAHDSWDLMVGNGKPCYSTSWAGDKEVITYHRFGNIYGVRPLVLHRSFLGAFPQYIEVDEEFRLYHNLAEDRNRGLLLSFDESGREIEVVRFTPNKVNVRLKYLRQFQAGIGLHFAIYIDSVRYSQILFAEVPPDEIKRVEIDTLSRCRWCRSIAKCGFRDDYQTISRLLVKVILAPPSREKSGIWPYEVSEIQKEVAFIIGVNNDGDEIEYTSNPDKLDEPGTPHYLTPVYFRREVLAKYFAEPDRYNVSDGQLTCLNLWSCQIDNDLESHVVVFLGDLGRDLPYEERLHWRQFNVMPECGISETNIRRSICGQFTAAKAPDLMFRHEYEQISREWEHVHKWPLFLAPSLGDEHLLDTIRIPVTNSQPEFDEQVVNLTKLLVDSLNEKELAARAGPLEDGAKGIRKMEGFLETTKFPERVSFVQFLKDLQNLRSKGSAHRKGSGYREIIETLGVNLAKKPDAFRRILEKAYEALNALRLYYCDSKEYRLTRF